MSCSHRFVSHAVLLSAARQRRHDESMLWSERKHFAAPWSIHLVTWHRLCSLQLQPRKLPRQSSIEYTQSELLYVWSTRLYIIHCVGASVVWPTEKLSAYQFLIGCPGESRDDHLGFYGEEIYQCDGSGFNGFFKYLIWYALVSLFLLSCIVCALWTWTLNRHRLTTR